MMMQPYKGYFIAGSVLLVHPFSPDWYVGGSVLVPGGSSSIVEITRFQLQQFTVSIKELGGMVRAVFERWLTACVGTGFSKH